VGGVSKPFRFEIVADGGGAAVIRCGASAEGDRVIIFRAGTQAKAELWLQVYLTLSLENRRRLREAQS
jgi:hypothetical protein